MRLVDVTTLIVKCGMAASKTEAQRLLSQAAVRVQLEPAEDDYPWETLSKASAYCVAYPKFYLNVNDSFILRVGKRMKRVTINDRQTRELFVIVEEVEG